MTVAKKLKIYPVLLICVNERIKKTSNFDDNSIVNVVSLCKMNCKKGANQHLTQVRCWS